MITNITIIPCLSFLLTEYSTKEGGYTSNFPVALRGFFGYTLKEQLSLKNTGGFNFMKALLIGGTGVIEVQEEALGKMKG
ncbi:MAG: hypothetical protein LUF27_13350 [Lachnospiraceae bacterium]|nr:hypothetical protein [Lachnospiraceae bacterium]